MRHEQNVARLQCAVQHPDRRKRWVSIEIGGGKVDGAVAGCVYWVTELVEPRGSAIHPGRNPFEPGGRPAVISDRLVLIPVRWDRTPQQPRASGQRCDRGARPAKMSVGVGVVVAIVSTEA